MHERLDDSEGAVTAGTSRALLGTSCFAVDDGRSSCSSMRPVSGDNQLPFRSHRQKMSVDQDHHTRKISNKSTKPGNTTTGTRPRKIETSPFRPSSHVAIGAGDLERQSLDDTPDMTRQQPEHTLSAFRSDRRRSDLIPKQKTPGGRGACCHHRNSEVCKQNKSHPPCTAA